MYKVDLEKAEEPEIKLPTSIGSQEKQENSRKISTSASLTVREACGQCSGAWGWISSLWSAMDCPVMSFAMGLCVRCDFGQPVC